MALTFSCQITVLENDYSLFNLAMLSKNVHLLFISDEGWYCRDNGTLFHDKFRKIFNNYWRFRIIVQSAALASSSMQRVNIRMPSNNELWYSYRRYGCKASTIIFISSFSFIKMNLVSHNGFRIHLFFLGHTAQSSWLMHLVVPIERISISAYPHGLSKLAPHTFAHLIGGNFLSPLTILEITSREVWAKRSR